MSKKRKESEEACVENNQIPSHSIQNAKVKPTFKRWLKNIAFSTGIASTGILTWVLIKTRDGSRVCLNEPINLVAYLEIAIGIFSIIYTAIFLLLELARKDKDEAS